MKIEYDSTRDLIYVWFGTPGTKAARTESIASGILADFDVSGKLIGLEVLDASEVLGEKVQVEVALIPSSSNTSLS